MLIVTVIDNLHEPYQSLEDPDVRRMALDDPRAFLDRLPDGGVLDEVQRAPELLSYLQTRVDADDRMGLFLLTGSQQFGITHNTAKSWVSVLEASYILFQLRPHYANFSKRLIKSPKLYFHDTGLLCWVIGIQESSQLATHPLRGSIFETFIISELVKTRWNRAETMPFYFWRDSNGNEVDVVVDAGTKLIPIEIKSGQTLNRSFFAGLERWMALAGDKATSPILIYGGTENHVRKGVNVLGWNSVMHVLSAGDMD